MIELYLFNFFVMFSLFDDNLTVRIRSAIFKFTHGFLHLLYFFKYAVYLSVFLHSLLDILRYILLFSAMPLRYYCGKNNGFQTSTTFDLLELCPWFEKYCHLQANKFLLLFASYHFFLTMSFDQRILENCFNNISIITKYMYNNNREYLRGLRIYYVTFLFLSGFNSCCFI